MHPQLFHLINLQRIDSEIRVQEDVIAAVPEAIAAVEAREKALDDELARHREGLEESQKARRSLEGDLELVKQKLAKYQDQLMQVKTNDAYRAMLKEIDGTKAEIATREEKILEQMLLSDDLEARIREIAKDFEERKAGMAQEKAALEKQRTEAESRKAALESEREQLAANLDEPVRRTYEKVAKMRHGVAVVGVKEELCLGCRMKVRPQIFQEIRQGTELHQCDTCVRFLYYVDPDAAGEDGEQPADL
ncbi:MAG: C4-type zinc ribbon domain-containing protein [Acidobacteriota bacterium]